MTVFAHFAEDSNGIKREIVDRTRAVKWWPWYYCPPFCTPQTGKMVDDKVSGKNDLPTSKLDNSDVNRTNRK